MKKPEAILREKLRETKWNMDKFAQNIVEFLNTLTYTLKKMNWKLTDRFSEVESLPNVHKW